MADTITVTYKVMEDGSLKRISKEADKAAKSTDKATRAGDNYSRGQKGVAGATSNSTKAFSKMQSSLGGSSGLVGAYATFAANLFAVTAAFGALQRAAQLTQLEEGFERLANTVGRTSSLMAKELVNVTDGAISMDQALRTAATGFSAGFSTKEMSDLAKVARGAATALGRDLGDAMDRLIRGTAKLEPEILDELGIFVKIGPAVEKYAVSLGKAATQLTATERQQAFLNATIEQGQRKFSGIGNSVDVNVYDQLAARFDQISKSVLNFISGALGPLISLLANNSTMLVGTLILFGSTIASSMFPILDTLGAKFERLSAKAVGAASGIREAAEAELAGSVDIMKEDRGVGKSTSFGKIQSKLIQGETISVEELHDAKKSLARSEATRGAKLKKLAGEEKRAAQVALKGIEEQRQAVEELIKARQGLGSAGRAEKRATRTATAEGNVGEKISSIGDASAMGGFKEASEGLKEYRQELPRIVANMEDVKTGFGPLDKVIKNNRRSIQRLMGATRMGSAAVRLFGAAFTNAIPFIGQIIFVLGLLVTGLKALFNWITKPTKAEAQLAAVTDNLSKKTEQLTETNDGLVSKWQEIEMAALVANASTTGVTDAMLDSAIATANNSAKVEAYANSLQVAAGVQSELASAVQMMGEELTAQPAKLGFFATRFTLLGEAIGIVTDFLGKGLTAIKEFFVYLGGGIVSAALETLDKIVAAAAFMAEKFGKPLVEALVEVDQALTGGAITEGLVEVGTAAIDIGAKLKKGFDMTGIRKKIRDFSDKSTESFNSIKAEGMASGIENALNGVSFESFLADEFANITANADTAEEANVLFAKSVAKVSAVMQLGAKTTQSQSDSIIKFKDNVSESQTALTKFATAAQSKNPYTSLLAGVKQVDNAVNSLRDTAAASGGEVTFAELLDAQLEGQAAINLEQYGTTVEQVKASLKDTSAFLPMQTALENLEDAFANNKGKIDSTKASLKDLQGTFANTQASDKFARSMDNFKKTGKFEISTGDSIKNNQADRQATLDFLKEELAQKKEIIRLESDLAIKKVEFAMIGLKAGSDALINLQAQKKVLEEMSASKGTAATTENEGKIIGANSAFMSRQASDQSKFLSETSTGTSLDRVKAFQEGGGLKAMERTDEEGNVTSSNMQGKAEVLGNMAGPMLEQMAALGPDGEATAAAMSGAFAVAGAWGGVADTFEAGGSKMEKGAAIAEAMGATLQAVSSAMAASSRAKIAGVEDEIRAEQKRDGKSAASVQKIKQLEKKKEDMKRKAFEKDKKMKMAMTIINTAAGIMNFMSDKNIPMAVATGVMGAIQLAMIASTKYQSSGGSVAGVSAPSKISLGERKNSVDLARGNNQAGETQFMRGASGQGQMQDFKPAFTGYKNRAAGGPTGFVVGEQGPELFVPEVPGNIVPSGEVQQGGGETNINFAISAVDAQGVEDMLDAQKGNIIRMIREAANQQGQFFLEEVQETNL